MKQASFKIGDNKIINTEKDNSVNKINYNFNENMDKKIEQNLNDKYVKKNKPKKAVENVYYFD